MLFQSALHAMRRWSCSRRAFLQPFQFVSILMQTSPSAAGAATTALAPDKNASGGGPVESGPLFLPPVETARLLHHYQQRQQHKEELFPFGISFAPDPCTFKLLVDTGPLLFPAVPAESSLSFRKEVQRHYDKRMRQAAEAQQLLLAHHQQRSCVFSAVVPSANEETAETPSNALPQTALANADKQAEAPVQSCKHWRTFSATALQQTTSREISEVAGWKNDQKRSKILNATAHSLEAAQRMKILTLRIAGAMVAQLPSLCAQRPRRIPATSKAVATRAATATAAADLAACCTAATAALQTLGLRTESFLGGFSARARLPRRRPCRAPAQNLEMVREQLLVSLEIAFR